jgi:hypothetical protein
VPIERVLDDLAAFLGAGLRQVKLVDRTFNGDTARAARIWEYLIKNDNGVTNFHFEVAADLLDDGLIELLGTARKGYFQFEVGVQSTNPETLAAIGRKTETGRLLRNVKKLRSFGNISQHLDLIAGLPHEGYDSFARSFDDAFGCLPDRLHVGFLKLLKGSGLRKVAAGYGICYRDDAPYEVLYTDWLDYGEMGRLRAIGEMVGVYYNSGRFTDTVDYLLSKSPSPFALFESLAGYWEANGCHLAPKGRLAAGEILESFKNVVDKRTDVW